MRVTWFYSPPIDAFDPPEDYRPHLEKQSGTVVGTVSTFFGGTKLIVSRDGDGKIIEVEIDRAKAIA